MPSVTTLAGAEILAHDLMDCALPADEHGIGGSLGALARATCAAYDDGLRALRSPDPFAQRGALIQLCRV